MTEQATYWGHLACAPADLSGLSLMYPTGLMVPA